MAAFGEKKSVPVCLPWHSGQITSSHTALRLSRGDNSGSTSLMESCIEYECVCPCVGTRPFVSPCRAGCYEVPKELTGCVNVMFCHLRSF